MRLEKYIKTEKLTIEIIKNALKQAGKGKKHILDKMVEICPEHKKELSVYAPKIVTLEVKPSKIGTITYFSRGKNRRSGAMSNKFCRMRVDDN